MPDTNYTMSHLAHLNKDRKLASAIQQQPVMVLNKKKYIHLSLCSSIISQQLSTKVADVIFKRFLALFPKKYPSPTDILSVEPSVLRAIGLSNAKVSYVRNVCEFFIAHQLTDARLHKMEDEAFIDFICEVKGIGRWTAEMILMFTLGREDVFAVDDLGIQQAMCRLYNIDPADKKEMKVKMLKLAEKWRPYRTYACRYLWTWKDGLSKKA